MSCLSPEQVKGCVMGQFWVEWLPPSVAPGIEKAEQHRVKELFEAIRDDWQRNWKAQLQLIGARLLSDGFHCITRTCFEATLFPDVRRSRDLDSTSTDAFQLCT